MMRTTSVRLPEEYREEIEEACKLEGVDKGAMLRKLIAAALKEYRIKRALECYREGKMSLWKAASMAKITYREALEVLKKRTIPFQYGKEDLEMDIRWAVK
jgi:predicted HTH domain antitoxin